MGNGSENVSRDDERLSIIKSYQFEFDPSNTVYSPRNAMACALASSLSYLSDKDLVSDVAKEWGCKAEFLGSGEPDWGLSLIGRDYVLTAFRGTDDSNDWWNTNIRVLPARTPWGLVHRGFLGAHERLWPGLQRIIDGTKWKSVWITGHSLGGAIAQLALMRITTDFASRPAAVYTFSQPRAAGWKFSNLIREHGVPYYRFVSSIDPTPDTPFNPWSTVGSEYYVDASGKIYRDGSAGFLDKGKDAFSVDNSRDNSHESPLDRLWRGLGIDAHSVDRYFEPLCNEISESER